MIKSKFIICLILLSFLSSCSTIKTEEKSNINSIEKSTSTEEVLTIADENILYETLQNISLYIRDYDSDGEIKTSEYLNNKLIEYGYTVEFQNFPVYDQDFNATIYMEKSSDYLNINPYNSESLGEGRNIIAKQSNFDKNKKTIYLTAHYDTTTFTTGVIDNGTGSAVILETARMLQNYNKDFNIGLIFFSAEEYFRFGSRYFISNLSDEEKDSIIGCINVDMVGEKNAGEVIIQTTSGKNNIISLMINTILKDKFIRIPRGGFSDDLSFYMGKVPVITLANELPNFNLDKESTEIQLQNVDITQLKDVAESIVQFITNFDISTYSEELKNSRDIDVENIEDEKKTVSNYDLIGIKERLLENGFDAKMEYTYRNANGNEFVLTEESTKFIPQNEYEDFMMSNSNDQLYYKKTNSSSNIGTNILYKYYSFFGSISGNISIEESLNILENYYPFY
jgi:hypothetical protein